jgi:hypothetical protein
MTEQVRAETRAARLSRRGPRSVLYNAHSEGG